MLPCGHDKEPFVVPTPAAHLRLCRQPWMSYVRWYTGSGMDMELLCKVCAEERGNGRPIGNELVCRECFEFHHH